MIMVGTSDAKPIYTFCFIVFKALIIMHAYSMFEQIQPCYFFSNSSLTPLPPFPSNAMCFKI